MVGCVSITPDLIVDTVMRAWPATIRVFLRHRLACIGCPAATLHTVADAAHAYQVDLEALLTELRAAASVPGDADQRMGIADDDPSPPAGQDP